MIQRMQSAWLFLAGATILSLLLVPTVTKNLGADHYELLVTGLYKVTGGIRTELKAFTPLTITIVATAVACFANIFNFKRRLAQKRGVIVAIVLILSVSFWSSRYAERIPGGTSDAKFGAGIFLPMIAIAFCVLAVRGINRDEKLIRSADRLR